MQLRLAYLRVHSARHLPSRRTWVCRIALDLSHRAVCPVWGRRAPGRTSDPNLLIRRSEQRVRPVRRNPQPQVVH